MDETKQNQLIRLKLTAAHILFSFWFIKFMQVRINKVKSKINKFFFLIQFLNKKAHMEAPLNFIRSFRLQRITCERFDETKLNSVFKFT